MKSLNVHLLPDDVPADELIGATCVVIDVLRASTTIVYALAAGARAVIPCLTIEDAQRRAAEFPRGEALLAGERGGLPIAGFDLGNAPVEFTPHTVSGKTVVLTTTNGTRALVHCRHAARIAVGAFVNLSAVVAIVSQGDAVHLICAGTDGQSTDEDTLFAGAVVDRLSASAERRLGETAIVARELSRSLQSDSRKLVDAMRVSCGGKNLIAIGMAADIETAAQIDRFAIVPRFDPANGEIRSEES